MRAILIVFLKEFRENLRERRTLYTALVRDPRTRDRAHAIYARARAHYHPISRQLVESVLRSAAKG